jgi:hypothetical protein
LGALCETASHQKLCLALRGGELGLLLAEMLKACEAGVLIRCKREKGVLGSGPEMICTPHERRDEAA